MVADAGGIKTNRVHYRDVGAARVFAKIHAGGIVVEHEAQGRLQCGAGGDIISGGKESSGNETIAGTDGHRSVVARRVLEFVHQRRELRRGGDGECIGLHVGGMQDLQTERGGIDFIDTYSAGHSIVADALVADDGQGGAGRTGGGINDGHGLR